MPSIQCFLCDSFFNESHMAFWLAVISSWVAFLGPFKEGSLFWGIMSKLGFGALPLRESETAAGLPMQPQMTATAAIAVNHKHLDESNISIIHTRNLIAPVQIIIRVSWPKSPRSKRLQLPLRLLLIRFYIALFLVRLYDCGWHLVRCFEKWRMTGKRRLGFQIM